MKNEFTVKKLQDETVYTLESASSGGTSAGAIASVSSPMGGVRKRGDNLIAQEEKKEAPKPRNFVAKNAKMGGAGQHKDKKKEQKQGNEKHKKPYMESLKGRIDELKSKLDEVSLGDYRKKAAMQKAQSQMGAMFGKPEEREKNIATFNKREKGLNRLKARDEKSRADAQSKQLSDLVARLPELKSEYERMKAEYKSLGGSDWQYADREQNLSPGERKARDMEGPMNNLWRQIQAAEKAQSKQSTNSEVNEWGGWDNSDLDSWAHIYKTSYPEKIKAIAQGGGIGVQRTNNNVAGAERILLQYWQEKGEKLTQAHVQKAKAKIQSDVEQAQHEVGEGAPALVKGAAGLALGGLAAAGTPALMGIFGPILGIGIGATGAYNAAKMGMNGADEIWDWAAKKLGGDNSAAEYAKAHMRAAAKGEDSFEFNGSTFKTNLQPNQVSQAAKVVKQVSESLKREVELSASLKEFYETSVMEKIPANAPVDVWIKDFEKSTAPQFRGKNKAKRKQMAIAASYGAKNPKKKK